jgi:sugar/nucleoside kinase (ribokinase family)
VQAGHAPLEVPPPAIGAPRDDLGAGDVFAAAFFVALHEGLAPDAAAAYGNAAAAVRIAGEGPDAIGDRRAIEARL